MLGIAQALCAGWRLVYQSHGKKAPGPYQVAVGTCFLKISEQEFEPKSGHIFLCNLGFPSTTQLFLDTMTVPFQFTYGGKNPQSNSVFLSMVFCYQNCSDLSREKFF